MTRDPDFDDRVRLALDPDGRAVDRMVSAALRRGRSPGYRRPGIWRLALAAAAVLVCALWVARRQPSVQLHEDDFVLTRAGEVVLIQSASGDAWILGPRRPGDERRQAGTGFVIAEGDTK